MDAARLRQLFDMTGRVAIVTGGTRGIGRALAEGYVAAGAKVVVASRKRDACRETEEHLRALGGDAIAVPAHLGDLDALGALVQRTVETYGAIDVVVNNAADRARAAARRVHARSLDQVLRRQPPRPGLPGAGGPAVAQEEPRRRDPERAIGSGLHVLGERLAVRRREGRAARLHALDGGRVRAVRHPRERARARHHRHRHGARQPPAQIDVMTSIQLMKRMAEPDEMVGPALLLTSDAGSFITGRRCASTAAWCRTERGGAHVPRCDRPR